MTPATILLALSAVSYNPHPVNKVVASFDPIITRVADAYLIPRHVARKLMVAESKGDQTARSKEWKKVKGTWKPGKVLARGLFQISVQYQEIHAKAAGVRNFDWRNPEHSTLVGLHLFRDLMDCFHGDLYLAVASYNAGASRIRSALPLPLETVKHLIKVFG